jgi:hypothetical protein
MSKSRRTIIRAALIVAAVMLLFPPWERREPRGIWFNDGYHFIAFAPDRGEINVNRLVIQLLLVGSVTFGFLRLAD